MSSRLRKSKQRAYVRKAMRKRLKMLRAEQPAEYARICAAQKAHVAALNHLSLKHVRRKGRNAKMATHWTEREVELLLRGAPAARSSGDWEHLFRVLGRSYHAIKHKWKRIQQEQRRR